MEALDCYAISPLFPFPDDNDLSDSDLPVKVLAYKKAAKKIPSSPFLSSQPTHPSSCLAHSSHKIDLML
jgi:hypothetical protein